MKAGASFGPPTVYRDEQDAHVVCMNTAGGSIQYRYHFWERQWYCRKVETSYHFQKVS